MAESKSRCGSVYGANIVYFFKETFRAHSRREYKEIFSRGLNRDNSGISGTYPWLYVRAFFALFILFTINVLVLRLTDNSLYYPSIFFLGGVTFSVPFIIFLYELYPKRDISLYLLFSVLVVGGTVSGLLAQLGYAIIPADNDWLSAVRAGVLEEVCKAIPAIVIISIVRKKNSYACYLLAAAVGAGFSIVEDMGYIFYYSENYFYFGYDGSVQAIISLFLDRGMSSFCSHILWTGAIGWAYYYIAHPLKTFSFPAIVVLNVGLHICWDLPLTGVLQLLDIVLCVLIALVLNIAIITLSLKKTFSEEVDLTAVNEGIIRKAKQMGERMRFTNAANLTAVLSTTILSCLILLFCTMPIGLAYTSEQFDTVDDFVEFMQCGNNLQTNWNRSYNRWQLNFEERRIEGTLSYVVQREIKEGYEYYYGYYVDGGVYDLDSISVELEVDGTTMRYYCTEYTFGNQTRYIYEVYDGLVNYSYHSDGTVVAVTNAKQFENYKSLIILLSTGVAVVAASTVILLAFTIKLRRIKDAEL
jgi:RsiW-degrading membrane proteinase PrsW (M82 family)